MKRKIVRFISVLLIMVLSCQSLSVVAMAAEQNGPAELLESKEQWGTDSLPSATITFGAKGDYDNGDFYGQLTTRQKACYDALEAITIDEILAAATVESGGKAFQRIRVNIDGMSGTVISGSFTGGKFQPAASEKSTVAGIYTDLCAAIVALRYDRPDLIWLGYLYYGYWVSQSLGANARVTDIVFDFYLEYDGQEKNMWESMMQNAQTMAEEAAQQSDTYQTVLFVHDALAEGNSYGDTNALLAHSPYSALVTDDETQPVCDGYSKAIKIVLDLLDIPNCTASSATHMWNNVRMDDGDWYNIDLTWDDNGEELKHDYFLVGSKTEIDDTSFSAQRDHVEENPYDAYRAESSSDLLNPVTLVFPTKNKNSYEYTAEDYTELRFADVKRSAWYYEHVETAAELGIFNGDKNGLFRPTADITRAEFASVMAKCLGVDVADYAGKTSFGDVNTSKWYAKAVAWAKEAGLMSGDKNGKFRPEDPITRQEMCTVLKNASINRAERSEFTFPDDAKIAKWASDAVYDCYAKEYISGDEKGYFNPKNKTSRAEAAVVCSRFARLDGVHGEQ